MDPVRAALYTALADDAQLTGLLSAPSSIFHQVIPQTAKLPAVVFSRQAGTPWWQFAGAHVQQDVWTFKGIGKGSSATRAEDIAARIDQLLTDASLIVGGESVMAIFRESEIDYLERDGADLFHHRGALYRLIREG